MLAYIPERYTGCLVLMKNVCSTSLLCCGMSAHPLWSYIQVKMGG